jgi:TolB protein
MMNQNHNDIQSSPSSKQRPRRIALRPITIILFLTVNMIVLMVLGYPYLQSRYQLPFNLPYDLGITQLPTASADSMEGGSNVTLPTETALIPSATPTASDEFEPPSSLSDMWMNLWSQEVILLSMQHGLDTNFYLYQPVDLDDSSALTFNPLTAGSWRDITPSLSPNRERLAFSSNRNGQWDIYLMDLRSGEISAMTDTPEYDASPTWSPDGRWIAYERYADDNLDIFLQSIDGNQDAIQLTTHFSADFAPVWSPQGRQIAFVSTRGGKNQIWLSNLDESGANRFVRLSQHYEAMADHPAWSPDGRYLVWAAVTTSGLHQIYLWDTENPKGQPKEIGSGDWAVWSPDGQALLVILKTPAQHYLTAYRIDQPGHILLPPMKLPGSVSGLAWLDKMPVETGLDGDRPSPTPLWEVNIDSPLDETNGRWNLIPLEDVEAPYARLHDRVDEAFSALRQELAKQVGWDLLATLENAYLPLSSALSPGLVEDWLYTGRAFTINTLPIKAGWMTVVREDFGLQTYWRVYLRARFQDGTQGQPLHNLPWDFNARYSSRPAPYDQGGENYSAVPIGYWVEFTKLAANYGWERLPALSNWQSAYPSARFNEFVRTDGLDWVDAMLEIYPPEVLLTLTPAPSATPSQTPAPLWYRSPTPTPTTRATSTPSPTATASTLPTGTATSSQQPEATYTLTNTPPP